MNAIAPPAPIIIRPQPGPQEMFLSTPADVALFGGAAGGGKTYALLIEPLRHIMNPGFGGVIFRRTSTQITTEGGLWDTSRELYPGIPGARSGQAPRFHWKFPSRAKISFAHLQYDDDVQSWQGSQIPFMGWDELPHFTQYQFFYMLSRNRSASGVRPYVRATCNPDADSWVADLIAWWIGDDGYPIPERAGVIRYFTRLGDEMIWGATRGEVMEKAGDRLSAEMKKMGASPDDLVKSFTFIPSKLSDNPALLSKDPGYWANLLALPRVERERLLGGNWKVRASGGSYFPTASACIIPAIPTDVRHWVRCWDLAATEPSEGNPSPDATAGLLVGRRENGRFVIADRQHGRWAAHKVREVIRNTGSQDKARVGHHIVLFAQDPGQAGKDQAQSLVAMMAGYSAKARRENGDKETRAEPLAAQWQVGNVDLVEGPWNVPFLAQMDGFPDADHDDDVDAASGAFNFLTGGEAMYDTSLSWV